MQWTEAAQQDEDMTGGDTKKSQEHSDNDSLELYFHQRHDVSSFYSHKCCMPAAAWEDEGKQEDRMSHTLVL